MSRFSSRLASPKAQQQDPLPQDLDASLTANPKTLNHASSTLMEIEEQLFFEIVTTDGAPESWKKIIECKVLFGRQLPRMPKDYMCKLLFDQRHYTFCMWQNNKILGACCVRPFAQVSALEIVFLAVSSGQQVRGHGTQLMNRLKTYAKDRGVTDLVTYADVAAIGYFSKQGFFPTEKEAFPKSWSGEVKDYDVRLYFVMH